MSSSNSYKHILVGVEGSEEAYAAFEKAVTIALECQGDFWIVAAMPFIPDMDVINTTIELGMSPNMNSNTDYDQKIKDFQKTIEGYKEEAINKGVTNVRVVIEVDTPSNLLLTTLEDYKDSLIVVGASTKRNTLKRFMVGSTVKHVVVHAQCNVLVVKNHMEK